MNCKFTQSKQIKSDKPISFAEMSSRKDGIFKCIDEPSSSEFRFMPIKGIVLFIFPDGFVDTAVPDWKAHTFVETGEEGYWNSERIYKINIKKENYSFEEMINSPGKVFEWHGNSRSQEVINKTRVVPVGNGQAFYVSGQSVWVFQGSFFMGKGYFFVETGESAVFSD